MLTYFFSSISAGALRRALRRDASTDGPVTIKLMPGVFEENLPLVVPNRVSIIGTDIRNTVVNQQLAVKVKMFFT